MVRTVGLWLAAIGMCVSATPVGTVSTTRSGAPAVPAPPAATEERGATYYALERSAVRVTTRFRDKTTAVSERDTNGTIRTRLVDVGGNEQAAATTDEPVTLDTANRRHHPKGDVESIESEWPEGFVARTVEMEEPAGRLLFTRLFQNGAEVGRLGWYPDAQVLHWSFPGLTRGTLSPERLGKIGGRWPFTPDMAWGNVQSLAFHRFHTRMKAAAKPQEQGRLARLINLIMPTLSANDAGCDGLHWLDNSIVRPCCDNHDLCYQKYGCSYTSWWQVWTSWRCDACNTWVVFCFLTADYALCATNPLWC